MTVNGKEDPMRSLLRAMIVLVPALFFIQVLHCGARGEAAKSSLKVRLQRILDQDGPYQYVLFIRHEHPVMFEGIPDQFVKLAETTEKDKSQIKKHLSAVRHLGKLRARDAIPYLVRTISYSPPGASGKRFSERYPHAAALIEIGPDALSAITSRFGDDLTREEVDVIAHVVAAYFEPLGGPAVAIDVLDDYVGKRRSGQLILARLKEAVL
jgi:hypothetical protein